MTEDEPEPLVVFPPGTEVVYIADTPQVLLEFPDIEDAIYFFELIRSVVNGEISLEVVKE